MNEPSNDLTPAQREALRQTAWCQANKVEHFMPEHVGQQAAAGALVRKGLATKVHGCRHVDTGREGVGYAITEEGIRRARALGLIEPEAQEDNSREEKSDET